MTQAARVVTYGDVSKYVEVELVGGLLPTGRRVVLRLEPLSMLEWASLGRSMPVGVRSSAASDGQPSDEETKENIHYASKVVAKAGRQMLAAKQAEDGTWADLWLDVQLLLDGEEPDPAVDAAPVKVSDLDRGMNIVNAFNALAGDASGGGPMAKVADAPFRS